MLTCSTFTGHQEVTQTLGNTDRCSRDHSRQICAFIFVAQTKFHTMMFHYGPCGRANLVAADYNERQSQRLGTASPIRR